MILYHSVINHNHFNRMSRIWKMEKKNEYKPDMVLLFITKKIVLLNEARFILYTFVNVGVVQVLFSSVLNKPICLNTFEIFL